MTVETRDISLAGRILAAFPDHLTEAQRVPDALAELGELATKPEANIIKLPNVSASLPQLREAIEELQGQGLRPPRLPGGARRRDAERDVLARYDRIKGSAVNPVLREGNSDRRAPASVKQYARKNPHSMGAWSPDSKTHVSTMGAGDFRSNERSVTVAEPTDVRIELVAADGTTTVLKASTPLLAGEVFDATVMSKAALVAFLTAQIADAKAKGVLFSLHLKATMMKVSDPIIFGHAVEAFFPQVFADARRRPGRGGHQPPTTAWPTCWRRSSRCRRTGGPPSRPASSRASPTAPRWRWSTPTAASPTCTCPATSSSTRRCPR